MILVDAGPLVAVLDARDQHHRTCTMASKTIDEPRGTTWPVLAEAFYLLAELPRAQDAILEMLVRGQVRILSLGADDVARMRELMDKYADLPMDLADASLVRVAERESIRTIFTIDRKDFGVYRLDGGRRLRIIP